MPVLDKTMPPPNWKPKKKQPESMVPKKEKPAAVVMQKAILKKTPTWQLQKHKTYFQKVGATWLLFKIFSNMFQHFHDLNWFPFLIQGNMGSQRLWRIFGILCAQVSLETVTQLN